MRLFKRYQPGDVVTVINDVKGWQALGERGQQLIYTVREVREENRPGHALQEKCSNSNCIHAFTHPQILVCDEGVFSGFWFDPEVNVRLKQDESLKDFAS